mgnify:CR=1 FL=1
MRRSFPERDVASVSPVRRGNRKTTSVVEFAADPAVVVQTGGDVDALRSEAAVTTAIDDATSIPVPTVLAAGRFAGSARRVPRKVKTARIATSKTTMTFWSFPVSFAPT